MKVTTATIGSSPAERPVLSAAVDVVRAFEAARKDSLSVPYQEALREIARRLERLARQFDELMDTNSRLMATSGFTMEFDPKTDSLVLRVGDEVQSFQLKRADPNVPIRMKPVLHEGAYLAGTDDPHIANDPELRLSLEIGLESFYQSAHRVLKLFGTMAELSHIQCMPITQVRNNLIEHPDDDQFYSFGFGSNGPRVKPMHRGTPTWNDDGLLPNTAALVTAIVQGIDEATKKAPT